MVCYYVTYELFIFFINFYFVFWNLPVNEMDSLKLKLNLKVDDYLHYLPNYFNIEIVFQPIKKN